MSKLDDSKMSSNDVENAQSVLEQAKQKRVQECGDEIAVILQKYGCTIVPQMIFTGQNITPRWLIVPVSTANPPARPVSDNNGK